MSFLLEAEQRLLLLGMCRRNLLGDKMKIGKILKNKKVLKKFKKDRADYEKKKGKVYYCPAK